MYQGSCSPRVFLISAVLGYSSGQIWSPWAALSHSASGHIQLLVPVYQDALLWFVKDTWLDYAAPLLSTEEFPTDSRHQTVHCTLFPALPMTL